MQICMGCGGPLTKRSQKIYCSKACQWSAIRQTKIRNWLETGQARVGGYFNNYVRVYLIDAQDGCCAICGCVDEWEGQPLTLVLDHVDGDATNNHRDNLRLVCPNCDSQLPTFKSRNRGKGRHSRRERYSNGQSY